MNVAVQVEFKADRKEPLGERPFVVEIEAAVGPAPEWFEPVK